MPKGWNEQKITLMVKGRHVDKSPRHREAAIKKQLSSTLRTPTAAPEPKFHPFMFEAYGISNADIEETIQNSPQPVEMRKMFEFLSFYSRFSDSKIKGIKSKALHDEIDFYARLLKSKMINVYKIYIDQSKDYVVSAEYYTGKNTDKKAYNDLMNTSTGLKTVAEKARKMSQAVFETQQDKVLFIEAVVSFAHTSGSIIPVAFGIEDYGKEDYWINKLFKYLRDQRNK